MILFTRSSSELEAELDKLIVLVHCYQHDDAGHKGSRINFWTTAFSVEHDDTKSVESAEKSIKRVLNPVSAKCIEITANDERCHCGIEGQRFLIVQK